MGYVSLKTGSGIMTSPDKAPPAPKISAWLVGFVVALFFAWGFSTVLVDTLLPKLKGLFQLDYAQATLTEFAFFTAYFVVSFPAAWLLEKAGYMRAIVVGLLVTMVGCLLFSPAASHGIYSYFLAALFVMAAGITILQVAANPLIALLGSQETSSSRLVLAQALNSFGTFVGPFVGAGLILQNGVNIPANILSAPPSVLASYRVTEAHATQTPFLGIAVLLALLALIFFVLRRAPGVPTTAVDGTTQSARALLANHRLAFGTACIFLYVGSEVSIGSLMVNYLLQAKEAAATAALGKPLILLFVTMHVMTPGAPPVLAVLAGGLVSFYWGGAMVGRFLGSAVQRIVRPGTTLAACALGAFALAGLSASTAGIVSALALIAVGLCNSIQFPTIFALAIEGLGENTPKGSALLCMGIVGGALVPVLAGWTADHTSLSICLAVPMGCYLGIALFGLASNDRLTIPSYS
jgi:FHS family L-fucose permease-like MFS transporter